MPTLTDEVRAGYARGWSFTPLEGKRPYLQGWASQPRPTLEQCLAWAEKGNVGLRTGVASGVVVIDVDAAGVSLGDLPPTWTALTGRGGRHYYFAIEPGGIVGNTAGKLAPKIDTRGDGGQVVFVGSTHPDTRNTYAWEPGRSPADIALALLPITVLPEAMQRRYRAGVMRAQGRSIRDIAAELRCGIATISRDLGENSGDRPVAPEGVPYGTRDGTGGGTGAEQGVPSGVPIGTRDSDATAKGVPYGTGAEQRVPTGVPSSVPPGTPPPGSSCPPPGMGPPTSVEMTPRQKQVFAQKALAAEIDTLTNQPSGGRNKQLNEAAMKLGSLIPEGWLDESEVRAALRAACEANGLIQDDGEAAFQATLDSGIAYGRSTPRVFPMARVAPSRSDESAYAIVPGAWVDDNHMMNEVSGGDFARDVMSRLPPDYIYRRDTAPGVMRGERGRRRFSVMSWAHGGNVLGDKVKPGKWVGSKKKNDDTRYLIFTPFTEGLTKIVLAAAGEGQMAPNITVIAPYPMPDEKGELPNPGLNPDGMYYDEPPELRGIEPVRDVATIHRILHEPICDFPFKGQSDRDNFIGLMLTPLVRRMIRSCVPMHVIDAPLPGSGKTRLAEQVLGLTLLGEPLAGTTWPEREDEARKVILSTTMAGTTLWHIDNVRDTLSSPSLASFITSSMVSDRVLATNTMAVLPNYASVIANGNNIQLDADITRRSVYIRLEPNTDSPSTRTKFKHPDLAEYVLSNRREILGALLGMIQNWIAAGSPPHMKVMGSFERWSKTVGGILAYHRYEDWRRNELAFRSSADAFAADLCRLVEIWEDRYGNAPTRPSVLMAISREHDLFLEELSTAHSDHGRTIAFSKLVVKRIVGRIVGRWKIVAVGRGSHSILSLAPAPPGAVEG